MDQVTLVLDNLRSAYNVGAIMRSAAAFGIKDIIAIGITPYPELAIDSRLPHVFDRVSALIKKTSLGAELVVKFKHYETFDDYFSTQTMPLYVLEQDKDATPLKTFIPQTPAILVIGNEVDGVTGNIIEQATVVIEINHTTQKESLNAASAASIALYHFSCHLKS